MTPVRTFFREETTRNFMKLFSGNMVAQGMSLLLAPVLSRLYSPDDFGLVALYLSIFSILSVVSTAKYEQAIMLPKSNRDAIAIVWLVLGITIVITAITLAATILFNRPLANMTGNPDLSPWLYFLPLSLLLHGIHQSATFYANRNKHFGLIARSTIWQYSILNATRLAAGWLKTTFSGLITGQIMAQLTVAIYMTAGIWKHLKAALKSAKPSPEPDPSGYNSSTFRNRLIPSRSSIFKQAKHYSGYPKYNLPLNFTNNLSGSLPVFMLTWGFSPAVAGLYAFGYTFVFRPIGLFSQSTLQVLSQKIIEDHHHKKQLFPSLKKLAWRFFLLAIVPVLALAIWAPTLFSVIFSDEYSMAGTILQYLSPYLLMVFITSPLSFIPEMYFRQKKAMVIDIIYLLLRFLALGAGIAFNNLTLAIALFSLCSTLVVGYNLFWYLSLAKAGDKRVAISQGQNKL
jgi:O-antigen/teichoic acid export membrane protein